MYKQIFNHTSNQHNLALQSNEFWHFTLATSEMDKQVNLFLPLMAKHALKTTNFTLNYLSVESFGANPDISLIQGDKNYTIITITTA